MSERRARVVLVHAPPHGEVRFHNIGLAYLQGALESEGWDALTVDASWDEDVARTDFYAALLSDISARVGDMGDGPDPALLLEALEPEAFDRVRPVARTIAAKADAWADRLAALGDVFLFATNTLTLYFAARAARRLRAMGKRTVAGGPSAWLAPLRRLLLMLGCFDAVAAGEAEPIVSPLVEALAGGRDPDLPGVTWRDADGGLHERPAGPPPDVRRLARPSFRGLALRDFIPALTSRGCVHRCAYCSEPSHWAAYRVREAADVVDEIAARAVETRLSEIHFHDDQINGSLRFVDELCAQLVEGRHALRWESFSGPQGLVPERLARMRAAGCIRLKIGIQSFSAPVLQRMRRAAKPEALRDAIVDTARAGISTHYDLLTCFPGESEDDHRRNLEIVESIHAARPDVYMSPNPFYLSLGSETMLAPEGYGLLVRHFDPDSLPARLCDVVRAAGRFPIGFSAGLPRETVLGRLADLGAILARYGKDYQYLGKDAPRG